MQKRKQEVNEAILIQAEAEFYTYGFEKASLRRIIKSSGTTIGNFYNYFKNKEDLYETLVTEEYEKFIRFMSEHEHQAGQSELQQDIKIKDNWKQYLPEILSQFLPDFSIRFVILTEGSKGTKFGEVRNSLVSLIKEHLLKHGDEAGVKISSEIGELLVGQFLDGIICIVKLHKNDMQTRSKLITEFMMFYFMGVMGLIEKD